MHADHIIVDVNIATMEPQGDDLYGVIEQGAVVMGEGVIQWLGPMSELPELDLLSIPVTSAKGAWVTPGLIDCHTHLVFAGNRAREFERRLQGESYQAIAEQGGGIATTVSATRAAEPEQLYVSAKQRLDALYAEGVTTVETKSGYGLDLAAELKLLEVAKLLDSHHPVSIQSTFLGAHALPKEYQGDSDGYIDLVCEQMLPEVAAKKLANAVDVFCEHVGFSYAQTERVLKAAQDLGFKLKLHAEQLSNMGGTALAAKYQALSSDHLEYLDEQGVKAMAQSGMVAVLLPGAFYYLRESQYPPIALLHRYNVPIAIATDFNPGTSPLCSLQLMMNMACTLFRLTPAQALQGVTCHAARALGLADRGTLAPGMRADVALWDIEHPAQLSYEFGTKPLKQLWIQGVLSKTF
ncbi:imidazolonepropionase [Pseudoalteromonas sp. MM17-2]|uniref:imidazolonepropionase n=1 Tax=Pseudoalteromonas sp. MM17-2 TaxID=2917753 RepID=UPI001EF6A03F|nr:imidazolonepropionase [Pseudoalteromonas sp. MM17-2]MCG7543813.1 imidazolonepropionase [Pseudoalteromonas sp. MM17-2]